MTEMIEPPWNKTPHLVLTKIYEYLDYKDRMNASICCKSWRSTIIQRKFFPTLRITFDNDIDRVNNDDFLCHLSAVTTDLTLVFDMHNFSHLHKLGQLFQSLELSSALKSLTLQPNSFICPNKQNSCILVSNGKTVFKYFIRPLAALLSARDTQMEKFDIGCSEVLAKYGEYLFKQAPLVVTRNLKHLHLATIKEDPFEMNDFPLSANFFTRFQSLQTLSVDYDYLDDEHLKVLEQLMLKELVIHVHNGVNNKEESLTENGWLSFKINSPKTEVSLTLMYTSLTYVQKIFHRTVPLVHLKMLSCINVTPIVLDLLSAYYESSLKSFVFVDSIADTGKNYQSNNIFNLAPPNPLVLLAWRCKYLSKLVIHGYEHDPVNLVGIARLRGKDLKVFEVSDRDISMSSSLIKWDTFVKQVSEALKRKWYPLDSYYPSKSSTGDMIDLEKEYITRLIRTDTSSSED